MDSRPFVIAMLLDNVRGTKFMEILEKGELPNIKEYIFDKNSCAYTTHSMSVFPSSSSNGHTTLTTGCYAGKSGVINAAYWIIPDHGVPERAKIDDISVKALKLWDEIITAKTMFEHVPSGNTASFHIIKRGAKIKFFKLSKLAKYAFLFLKMKRKGVDSVARANTELFRNIMKNQVCNYLKRIGKHPEEMPEINFILFLPSDLAAHFYGYDSPEYLDSLKLADELVEIFVKGFTDEKGRTYPGFIGLGMLDSVVWALFSDHASKPFQQDQIFDMVSHLRECWAAAGKIFAFAPEPGKDEDLANWNVIFSESGEFFGIIFRDPKTGHPLRQMIREELSRFSILDGLQGRDLLKDFFAVPEVARIFLLTNQNEFVVIDRDGEAIVRRADPGPDRKYSYEIVKGSDPLDYATPPKAGKLVATGFHSHLAWLDATWDHAIPDLFDHFFGYFDSPHAMPLIVTTKKGAVFWNPDNPKDKPQEKLYQHDGEYAEEKTTPFVLSGPGITDGARISHCRNVDVLPTILRALNIVVNPAEIDGRVIEEFFNHK